MSVARDGRAGPSHVLFATMLIAAAMAAFGGQAWIRSQEPVGLQLPPPAADRPAPAVVDWAPDAPPCRGWAALAAELGPDAVTQVLDGPPELPSWRLAVATADPAFAVAVTAAGRALPTPDVARAAPALDLPGLRATRADDGAVGWVAPVGRIAPGDVDAVAGLIRAWVDPEPTVVGGAVAAALVPGSRIAGEVVVSDVHAMDGWERGPRVGASYSLVLEDGQGGRRSLDFEVTPDGGRLYAP